MTAIFAYILWYKQRPEFLGVDLIFNISYDGKC
jgi:hypothetical protein